jgi:type IV secretion system protein VirD4
MRGALAVKILGAMFAAVIAASAALWLWELAFVVAIGLHTHKWAALKLFFNRAEFLMPLSVALARWHEPVVWSLIWKASFFWFLGVVLIAAGIAQAVSHMRGVPAPTDGARLAGREDLKKAGLLGAPMGYSVFLGRFGREDVRYAGDSHIFVNGPSRSGKGYNFVFTNALEWRGSLIAMDIKKEILEKTGAARVAMGQRLFVFSPGSVESHRWNPLDCVGEWPSRATDVMNIAKSMIETPANADAYWVETAHGLFGGLLAYVLESRTTEGKRTLQSVLKMFSTGASLGRRFAEIIVNEPELHPFIVDKFRQHLGRDEEQRLSFESHIVTSLEPWNNELVAAATSCSDFDVAEFRRKPFTVLLCSPPGNLRSVMSVIRLFVEMVHDVLLRHLPGPDEPYKVLLLLDEFYQFKKQSEIVDRTPLVAGYGFQIAMVSQSIASLDVTYGKSTREMLLGNMDVKLFVAIGDELTADYVSRALGKHYVLREGWGESNSASPGGWGGMRQSRSIQRRWEPVPLISPDALGRLDNGKMVLLLRGQWGSVLEKANFYRDAQYLQAVKAAQPFERLVSAPNVLGDKALNDDEPNEEGAGGRPGRAAIGRRHWPAIQAVRDLASRAFVDPTMFNEKFVDAMEQVSNQPLAELAATLRQSPEKLGTLKIGRGMFARRNVEDVLLDLRKAAIAAKRSLNDDRAQLVPVDGAPVVDAADAGSAADAGPETGEAPAMTYGGGEMSVAAQGDEPDSDSETLEREAELNLGAVVSGVERLKANGEVVSAALKARFGEEVEGLSLSMGMFLDTPDDLWKHIQKQRGVAA